MNTLKKHPFLHYITQALRDMCYISAKEFHNAFTDEGMVIFFLLVPILYPVLYCWIYNEQMVHEVPVAVVDMNHSKMSREYIRHLDATQDIHITDYCNDLNEGRKLVGLQQVKGVVYIPQDFERRIARHEQTHVSIFMDMSVMLNYKQMLAAITEVNSDMNARIQIKRAGNFTDQDDATTTAPMTFDSVPLFSPVAGYGDTIIPPVMMLILYQTLLLGIGLSAGTARENNRYRELIPVSQHYNGILRIVLGKAFCYLTIYITMAGFTTVLIPHLFGYVQLVTFKRYISLLLPFLTATIFFGMMLSCLVRYRENVIMLVMFTSVPLLFMSNVSWPLSDMPGIWQGVASVFPSTWGLRAWQRLNTMEATIDDVQIEYKALWIQAFCYFVATCLVYRHQLLLVKKMALEEMDDLKDKAIAIKARKLRAQAETDNAK
jgi:ABC-2 type transport system permease protein